MDGFVVIDDSKNFVIENEAFLPREETTDLYLFAYRNDLGLCLQDYFTLTGYPPMIPRYALGCWWYKNDVYNMTSIDDTLKKFNDNKIPISIFLLGDKWHNNIENYMYDRNLFDVQTLNRYYFSKPQVFGLTINPELPISNNDPLYNTVAQYIQANKNGISLIPLNNNTINIIKRNIEKHGIEISFKRKPKNAYGEIDIEERHRHRYELNNDYRKDCWNYCWSRNR